MDMMSSTTAMTGMHDHDHGHHHHTATSTLSSMLSSATAAATGKAGGCHSAEGSHNHMGHTMDHSMGGSCKISMLFNLNTIDACFLSEQWHITTNAGFAGSCIGVFLLGMSLELLRRAAKKYDRYLVKQHLAKFGDIPAAPTAAAAVEGESFSSKEAAPRAACAPIPSFRPSILQQAVRAFLHLLVFAMGYILMLLAMYYNGYILLCIFLGAFFGAFIFQWESLPFVGQPMSATREVTVCCG